jgi:hypothetical protein
VITTDGFGDIVQVAKYRHGFIGRVTFDIILKI